MLDRGQSTRAARDPRQQSPSTQCPRAEASPPLQGSPPMGPNFEPLAFLSPAAGRFRASLSVRFTCSSQPARSAPASSAARRWSTWHRSATICDAARARRRRAAIPRCVGTAAPTCADTTRRTPRSSKSARGGATCRGRGSRRSRPNRSSICFAADTSDGRSRRCVASAALGSRKS